MSNPLSRRRFVQTSAVAVAGFPALVSSAGPGR
ncbi:MAG: twin-arginine translocation signal domain-containing protein [Opitutales bacterium]